MRALLILLACCGVVVAAHSADAVTGRVVKVLPFLVDQQGRIATSPSLFDRDAYQAQLRAGTNEVSAVRIDVLWKATKSADAQIKLAVELRGVGTNGVPTLQTLQTNVVPGTFRQWTSVPLAGDDYQKFGHLVAWHVSLWNGSQLLSEQKSFLW
jgi:hypothetical protein